MTAKSFSSLKEFNKYIDKIGIFHINPSLDAISEVLGRLSLQNPPFAVCQIVGTNGKGSSSAFLSSLCSEHGLKTGLFSSPHFISPKERILINGQQLSDQEWLEAAAITMANGGEKLTYFEVLTTMALLIFKKHKLDIIILEAGLGGSWDTSSAIRNDLLLFTAISLDHKDVLGDSLAQIAADKAGAIRSDSPVVSTEQTKEVMDILIKKAEEKGAAFYTALNEVESLGAAYSADKMLLSGDFQKANACLALKAFELIPEALKKAAVSKKTSKPNKKSLAIALEKAWIPGRMHRIPAGKNLPPFILDGAHNAHGMAALGLSLAKEALAPSSVIFACLKDKEPQNIIPHLKSISAGPFYIPPLHNSRSMPPKELADMIGLAGFACNSLEEAINEAREFRSSRLPEAGEWDFPVLICGSLYLLSDFFKLYPELLAPRARP